MFVFFLLPFGVIIAVFIYFYFLTLNAGISTFYFVVYSDLHSFCYCTPTFEHALNFVFLCLQFQ